MRFLSWIIFFSIVLVEGVITTIPLTLVFLLCLTVMKRQEWIFPLAFIAGILLDILAFRPVGISSIFFVSYIFLLLLYQRKYETATMPFIIIASFVGSTLYLLVIGQAAILIQSFLCMLLAAVSFSLYRTLGKSSKADGFQHV